MKNMTEELKKKAALRALEWIPKDSIIGVGTGSTVNYFIEALGGIKNKIVGAVPSSIDTEKALIKQGISIVDLNSVQTLPVYVDGADQSNQLGQLIKGGGGALTREKIVASVANKFICVMDEEKISKYLGSFPVPVEVIPMARSYVARECIKLGGIPKYRENFVTDNGNIIIDVKFKDLPQPIHLEEQLNQITGIVMNGLFAKRGADILIIGTEKETLVKEVPFS